MRADEACGAGNPDLLHETPLLDQSSIRGESDAPPVNVLVRVKLL